MGKELASSMKKNRQDADLKENRKQSIMGIEDKIIEVGKKARSEVSSFHYNIGVTSPLNDCYVFPGLAIIIILMSAREPRANG